MIKIYFIKVKIKTYFVMNILKVMRYFESKYLMGCLRSKKQFIPGIFPGVFPGIFPGIFQASFQASLNAFQNAWLTNVMFDSKPPLSL